MSARVLLARFLFTLFCILNLAACRIGEPAQMTVSFSAYEDRPVVLTKMAVNGVGSALIPSVVRGKADTNRPLEGASRRLLSYPSGSKGVMALDLTWVELPSGRAYSTQIDVPLNELEPSASGGIEFMPVFAPGGLLIITSDPVPKTASDKRTRDVVRVCGVRVQQLDEDFAADPGRLPALREALASAKKGQVSVSCQP